MLRRIGCELQSRLRLRFRLFGFRNADPTAAGVDSAAFGSVAVGSVAVGSAEVLGGLCGAFY